MTFFFLYHPSNVQWLAAVGESGAPKKKKLTKKELRKLYKKYRNKAEEEVLAMYLMGNYD